MAKKRQDNDLGDWGLILFLFVLGVWPVALFLMFTKLFGASENKRQTAPPLNQTAQSVKREGTKRTTVTPKKIMRSPAAKRSTAKWLQITGVILLALGALATVDPIQMMLYHPEIAWWQTELLEDLAILVAGGALLGSGFSMDRSLKRFARYLAVMGDREAVSFEELARTTGYSKRKVGKDLQKMLDRGYFGGKAYLNMELGYFFRSSDAAWKARQEHSAASVPKEAEEGYSGILRNIRRANDRIADPVLSAKIDRLEEITGKIFREVEQHPEKQSRISTFLNYYLPTTQKLLDSYADFESAGVEGENLNQAKSRIEDTMDSIVRGFEHQLDALYHVDAMDVASDIQVMETMLRRDTSTAEQDFGLGGTAMAREEKDTI